MAPRYIIPAGPSQLQAQQRQPVPAQLDTSTSARLLATGAARPPDNVYEALGGIAEAAALRRLQERQSHNDQLRRSVLADALAGGDFDRAAAIDPELTLRARAQWSGNGRDAVEFIAPSQHDPALLAEQGAVETTGPQTGRTDQTVILQPGSQPRVFNTHQPPRPDRSVSDVALWGSSGYGIDYNEIAAGHGTPVVDGVYAGNDGMYRYLGGDPSEPGSYEKVRQ